MPRYAILTGRPHGEPSPVVILDPSHPIEEQKAVFKDYCRAGSDPDFAEVQLWTSDAGVISQRRLTPAEGTEPNAFHPETPSKARGNQPPKGKPAAPKKE